MCSANWVQHRTFEWQVFEQGISRCTITARRPIAGQVTCMLQREADALAPMFGRQLEGPSVLVFNSQEEFRQSNVGVMLGQDEASNSGIGPFGGQQDVRLRGRPPVCGGKCARLAQAFNQTMYETDWSQAIRSGSVVWLPPMFDGLARYAARGDAASQETILDLCRRDAFRQRELASGLMPHSWAKPCGLTCGHLRPANGGQRAVHDPGDPERRKGSDSRRVPSFRIWHWTQAHHLRR